MRDTYDKNNLWGYNPSNNKRHSVFFFWACGLDDSQQHATIIHTSVPIRSENSTTRVMWWPFVPFTYFSNVYWGVPPLPLPPPPLFPILSTLFTCCCRLITYLLIMSSLNVPQLVFNVKAPLSFSLWCSLSKSSKGMFPALPWTGVCVWSWASGEVHCHECCLSCLNMLLSHGFSKHFTGRQFVSADACYVRSLFISLILDHYLMPSRATLHFSQSNIFNAFITLFINNMVNKSNRLKYWAEWVMYSSGMQLL